MSFDRADSRLHHILQAIEHIREFVGEMTFEQYEQYHLRKSAVERMFQILTEAAFTLGRDAPTVCPGVDWQAVRDMANFLRHDYEAVEDRVVWDAIQYDFPEVEIAVRKAVQKEFTTLERPQPADPS